MNAKGISVLKEEIQYHKECIEKIEKILALSESQSVSDNETKEKLCEFYPDKCDYDKDFDCPYIDNEDILCYEQ